MKPDKPDRPERPNKPEKPNIGGKMSKIIFCALFIAGLCFGQGMGQKSKSSSLVLSDESSSNTTSKAAVGIIGGLNYAFYLGDDWPAKTTSLPRINVGINSRFRLSSLLSKGYELSYLRLFYNTKRYYWDTSSVYQDRITFDNIYISSALRLAILTKGFLTPHIGIGLAYIWPFAGTWDNYRLSYKNVNNCKTWFGLGMIGVEVDKYPFANSILSIAVNGHFYPYETFAHNHVYHPFVFRKGVAISESIPLRFTLSLFWKI